MTADLTEVKMRFCLECALPEREYTTEERIAHVQHQIEDLALLQALNLLHGNERGLIRYLETGGLLHITSDMREDPDIPDHVNDYVDAMERARDAYLASK